MAAAMSIGLLPTETKKIRRYGEYRHKITITIKKPIGLGICKFNKPTFV